MVKRMKEMFQQAKKTNAEHENRVLKKTSVTLPWAQQQEVHQEFWHGMIIHLKVLMMTMIRSKSGRVSRYLSFT